MVIGYKAIDNKYNIQVIFLFSKLFRMKFFLKPERITLVGNFTLNNLTWRLVELISWRLVEQNIYKTIKISTNLILRHLVIQIFP